MSSPTEQVEKLKKILKHLKRTQERQQELLDQASELIANFCQPQPLEIDDAFTPPPDMYETKTKLLREVLKKSKLDEIKNFNFTFGKYKGRCVLDVAEFDSQYVKWCKDENCSLPFREMCAKVLNYLD